MFLYFAGVLNITEVNFAHQNLKGVKKLEKEEEDEEEEENIAVVQAFTCNAHVTQLFSLYGKEVNSPQVDLDNTEASTYLSKGVICNVDTKCLVVLCAKRKSMKICNENIW